MQVVDPHIHLWNLEDLRYGWLAEPRLTFMGDHSSLARTHGVAEFLAEAEPIEVLKVVHVEAGHDPADPLAETRWLQGLADAPGNREFPQGIVAHADLSAPDVADVPVLRMRGVRHILNVSSDPLFDYVGRHYMREPAWREGFRRLREHGLSFDLQIYPSQMPEAAALARANADIQIILNHTGMFIDRDSAEGWRRWRDGMRELAACENVAVKISGMGMIDHAWTVESLRPLVLETIDAFGTGRAMFASNFPVDRLYSGYAELWQAFDAIVAGAGEAERHALFRANAEKFYRI